MEVWATWCLRQIVRMHNLAVRQEWRDRSFQAALHGVDLGPEPKMDLHEQESSSESDFTSAQYEAWKARRKRGS